MFFKSFVSGNMMVSHKLTCDEVNHLKEQCTFYTGTQESKCVCVCVHSERIMPSCQYFYTFGTVV